MTTQAKQKKHNAKLPKIPSDKSMKQFLVKEIAALITRHEYNLSHYKDRAEVHYNKSDKENPDGWHYFKTLNYSRNEIRIEKSKLQKLRHLQKILKTLPDHILTEDAAEGIRVMFGEKR